MSEYTKLFERAGARFVPPSMSTDGLLHRRDRKRRNKRITAALVGIAVFVAVVWIVRDVASLNRTTVVPGGPSTGPTKNGPTYNGPTYTLGPVTKEDIAVGESFMQAWVDGDGKAAAAMFSPDGTFDGFQPGVLPALHDWFRAGGWTLSGGGCGVHGWSDKRGVVGCIFTFENDLSRALGLRPVPKELSFAIDAGMIETAWFGGGGDCCHNMFGSPDPLRPELPGVGPDLFGAVWDMFIGWLSSNHPEDFRRMYDPDYGYPVRGYPILDPASVQLWERYTDEFVASSQALRRSFSGWMANQSFLVQAGRICMTASQEFWETEGSGRDLHGRAFDEAFADVSEEILADLRAIPLGTEADRATMDAFVPLAERWIKLYRQAAEEGADVPFFERRDLQVSMGMLIDGCLISYGLPG